MTVGTGDLVVRHQGHGPHLSEPLVVSKAAHGRCLREEDTRKRGASAPDTSLPRPAMEAARTTSPKPSVAAGSGKAPWVVRPGCRSRSVRSDPLRMSIRLYPTEVPGQVRGGGVRHVPQHA